MRPIQQLLCGGVVTTLMLFITFHLSQIHSGELSIGDQFSRQPKVYNSTRQRLAYATFLSTRIEDESKPDPYFTAARVLAYQLLHHPVTRTQRNIPFLVLVPPHVSEAKRERLIKDGATIVPVDLLEAKDDWARPAADRWKDQFAKLRLFEQTDYDRILYMDGDMLLTKPLDGIWDEEVARPQKTLHNKTNIHGDEAPLPAEYLLAGVSDTGGGHHPWPPRKGNDLNGGFFLLKPSIPLFEYYSSVMNIKDRFDPAFMEQSLLTYAHRRDGNMPWKAFPPGKWNANWPGMQDVKGGAASLHDKFWDSGNKGWIDREVVEMWWRMQGEMEGYWQRINEELNVKP